MDDTLLNENNIRSYAERWERRVNSLQYEHPREANDMTWCTLYSKYDFWPARFFSPVILHPKLLLQRLTREKLDFDDQVNDDAQKWYSTLEALNKVKISRCMTLGLKDETKTEVHVLCNASRYASFAYYDMKITDKTSSIKTSILMWKSRAAPHSTIPRLELLTAGIGAKMYQNIID